MLHLSIKPLKGLKPEELRQMLTVTLQNLKILQKEITTEQTFSLYTLKQDNKVFLLQVTRVKLSESYRLLF